METRREGLLITCTLYWRWTETGWGNLMAEGGTPTLREDQRPKG